VRRIGIGREQLLPALYPKACQRAERGGPNERRQRLVTGHREEALLRVGGPPGPGQDGGIGAEFETRVRHHLRQTPRLIVRLETSGTRRPRGGGQDPCMSVGVVLPAAHIAIRHEDELLDLFLSSDCQEVLDRAQTRVLVEVVRQRDRAQIRDSLPSPSAVQHFSEMGRLGELEISAFVRSLPVRPEVLDRLRKDVLHRVVHGAVHRARDHGDGLRPGNRGSRGNGLHPHLRVVVFHATSEERQRILQAIVPSAHDARREGASARLLRFQQLRQDRWRGNLDRGVGADRLVEVALVVRAFRIQVRDPPSENGRDLLRVTAGELALRLVARPALGRFEGGHDLVERRIQELRSLHERRRGRGDPPDPTMRLVARRIPILVILVADDRVVPVDDVDGPVRPDLHADRTEVPVTRVDERLFPLQGCT